VENIPYGPNDYHDDYRPEFPHHTSDYSLDPQAHHDAYYTQPYDPSPQEEMPQPYGSQPDHYWQDDEADQPMMHNQNAYGPDPHDLHDDPFQDEPHPTPSPAPTAPIKRWKTVKEVQLFKGNLVLDCPIPPRLLNQVPHAQPPERDEFTHMRYSAATCDPKHFDEERFTLRQKLFAKPRHTELFIVITMYNEEDELFARTMSGVIKNIEHMNNRPNSKTWGKDAWKKIVVCVVSDGRAKINPRTRAVLAGLGVYQDGIAKQQVNGKDVTAHIYEYTTQMALDIKKGVVSVRKGNTPVQMLFCLKEKNQKKINSHRWFFQAFGKVLDPNICVLIDAGTKPGKDSIYQLWKAFDLEPMCAGACGEIKAMLVHGKKLLNPLVATQNFEYKMSNILDKPLESAFGFISVLPGAFSAYRYIALLDDKTGQGPLQKYFLGEEMHGTNAGIFTANMYLAEDRILCFELVSKRQCHWILQYVKSATGETDVPVEMADFILQRRRWLNGSFFAAVYSLAHSFDIFRSDHSFLRKMAFLVEFFYQSISMLFAWFALGNFFLVFRILTKSLATEIGTAGTILFVVFEWLYIGVLITCFILALGNRPQGSNRWYMSMVYFWAIIMAYLMFASIFITVRSVQSQVAKNHGFNFADIFRDQIFFTLIVSLASTYLMWFIVSFIFLDPWHMFTCFIQYLLMTPTYINILNVYAFCNTHDITWGTKGDTKAEKLPSVNTKADGKAEIHAPTDDADLNTMYENEIRVFSQKYVEEKKDVSAEDKQEDYYKGFRSGVVLFWMFCNLALTAAVLQSGGLEVTVKTPEDQEEKQNKAAEIYLAVVLWSVAGLSAFRFVGAMWFLIVRMVSLILTSLCGVYLLTVRVVPWCVSYAFDELVGWMVGELENWRIRMVCYEMGWDCALPLSPTLTNWIELLRIGVGVISSQLVERMMRVLSLYQRCVLHMIETMVFVFHFPLSHHMLALSLFQDLILIP
jgi:chitin synthase